MPTLNEQTLNKATIAQTVSVDCVEVQPADYEFNLRGLLAAKLLCWHRLTEAEAQNILQVFEAAGGGSK